jgi:hypothetical protein
MKLIKIATVTYGTPGLIDGAIECNVPECVAREMVPSPPPEVYSILNRYMGAEWSGSDAHSLFYETLNAFEKWLGTREIYMRLTEVGMPCYYGNRKTKVIEHNGMDCSTQRLDHFDHMVVTQ